MIGFDGLTLRIGFFTDEDRRALAACLATIQEVKRQMATQQDLQNALDAVNQQLEQLHQDLDKALTDLLAAIQAGKTGPDLQPQVDALTAIKDGLAHMDSDAVAADQTVNPPPPPPPAG